MPSSKSRATDLAVLFLATASCLSILELLLPRFDHRFIEFFHRDLLESTFDPKRAAEALASSDPDLGWDRPPPEAAVRGEPYFAQAYGDSFTLSGHDGPTWQEMFTLETGKAILNLGVSAYGLDQAVLKSERDVSRYSGELVILGIYGEMYRRSLSYHSYYYFVNAEHYRYLYKPFFTRSTDGFLLHRPPCRTLECLRRALYDQSSASAKVRAEHDFWYRRYSSLPSLAFPRLLSYARALPYVVSAQSRASGTVHYFPTTESLELAKHLVMRFGQHTRAAGKVPVLLLLYGRDDLELMDQGIRRDQPVVSFLEESDLYVVDSGAYLRTHRAEFHTYSDLVIPDGHLNRRGNRLVAEALSEGLRRLGLLDPRGGAQKARHDESDGVGAGSMRRVFAK